MRTLPAETRNYEFRFPKLNTHLQVQVLDRAVTVLATRNSFSDERKVSFIRELAAEGFIPDEYRWFSVSSPESLYRGVRWLVDFSWLKNSESRVARRRRFTVGLAILATLMSALALGWTAKGHHDFAHRGIAANLDPRAAHSGR